jgi:hypothetical protein
VTERYGGGGGGGNGGGGNVGGFAAARQAAVTSRLSPSLQGASLHASYPKPGGVSWHTRAKLPAALQGRRLRAGNICCFTRQVHMSACRHSARCFEH